MDLKIDPRREGFRAAFIVGRQKYVSANCSHCHRKWGGGNAEFQLLASLPLNETGTLNTPPGQGKFGLQQPALLVPGKPEQSLIYHRMTRLGLGRMPHVGSNVSHQNAVNLIRAWIEQLSPE